jgi:hypothetical protein
MVVALSKGYARSGNERTIRSLKPGADKTLVSRQLSR